MDHFPWLCEKLPEGMPVKREQSHPPNCIKYIEIPPIWTPRMERSTTDPGLQGLLALKS